MTPPSSLVLAPAPLPVKKTPAKPLKQAPPEPTEIYIHVPYLTGTTRLDEVATAIFHHIDSDKVKARYDLEADSNWLQLKKEYAKEFKKRGEDASAFIYLPKDIQAAHINHKGSKTGGGTHKKVVVLGVVDSDDQLHDTLKDEAVGLTEAIKAARNELTDVLKRCKCHKEVHCHVDKQGWHYPVGYNQRHLWGNKLAEGMGEWPTASGGT
ncbi:hypothetical protein K439DRAFT_1615639 [Ramaria rubella]|nr:hypothetical protein K439DRAFT_1615639 [Ramaria rubella]